MQGKATIAGHPIHPMFVALPIGFFVGALVCDIILALTHNPFWPTVSVVLIGFGIVAALLAALFGFIDYFTAPMTGDTKATATRHMILNLVAVVIFAIAFWLRWSDNVSGIGIALTVLGVLVLAVSGWLGGHLSYHYGVGVEPSSERPATLR
ncbi:MAG TPA: DUF2231 domain-containing protein [Dongiaceae bacterium]|nr:DUF2231 domain-containing protein [Dongiaceae bacterium]